MGSRNPCKVRTQRGYTLIEVLVACSLASAVVLAAAPSLPAMRSSFSLQNAAFQVANDLRLARARAVATNGRARIVFTTDGYQIRRESPVGSGTYVDDGAPQSMPAGVTIESDPVDPTFDSRGLMTQPYTITLTNSQSTTKTIDLTIIGRINVD
jgi:prepilin-type N-terminal cleavage/methylation domain-containing protein